MQLEVIDDAGEAQTKIEKFADKTFDEPRPFPFELDVDAAATQ